MGSCNGKRLSESFGNQILHFCHLDKNGDGIYQASSDSLSIRQGDAWYEWQKREWHGEGSSTFQEYRDKFGLPNFEGLNLAQWQGTRAFVYLSHKEEWNTEIEKKLSNVVEYHAQGGIDLYGSVMAAIEGSGVNFYAWPSPGHQVDVLTIVSILHYAKAKMPIFYRDNRDFIDLVSQKISDEKLNVTDGNLDPIQGEIASYDMLLNSMHLVNPTALKLFDFDGVIIHELMHFSQDILEIKISVNEAEVAALLVQAEFILSKAGLLDNSVASQEKLENFIKEYKAKQKKPSVNWMTEHPLFFALRKVYYQKHQDKQLEEKNLNELIFAQENLLITPEITELYPKVAPALVSFLRKKYPNFKNESLDTKLSIIDSAIKEHQKALEEMMTYYSAHLKSAQLPDTEKIEEYRAKILMLKCGIVFLSKEKLVVQGVSKEKVMEFQTKLFLEAIKWATERYFYRDLPAQTDGVR